MFHMYVGVRAGGGIGDEIDDPAGDEFEMERVVFDITFFFFVIVILLAIIQGESSPRSPALWLCLSVCLLSLSVSYTPGGDSERES